MSTLQEAKTGFTGNYETFEVKTHPQSKRLYHLTFSQAAVETFFSNVKEVSPERLEYVPYMRHIVAKELQNVVGPRFVNVIRGILFDRETGGFTIGVQDVTKSKDEYVVFSTALSYLVGTPNFDSMSGKYYARFAVKDTDNSDSYLRQAYRRFTLHTDGTFVDEPTDWLLMMKMEEENAIGGESRLLHLDDWEELDRFYHHSFASYGFTYKAPASKNVSQEITRTTFFLDQGKPCMCFIDQFAYPENIELATYLQDLSDSMEEDKNVLELTLPVGDLIVLNNKFWLHGRSAFEKNPNLYRELLRQRGSFATT